MMTKQFKTITTNKLDFNEITDLVYNDLLLNTSNIKYIKIHINFFNNKKKIERFFFFKVKNDIDRYKFRNYLYTKFKKFSIKYVNFEIDEYVIKINFSSLIS